MTVADNLKRALYQVRSINGRLGFRPHAVAIVDAVWSGPQVGDGVETVTTLPITEANAQPPRCRWLNDEQIAVGGLAKGTVSIGPITPLFTNGGGGGTDIATLIGTTLATGGTIQLRIVGPNHPNGALYRVTNVTADKATRYTLTAEPVVGL